MGRLRLPENRPSRARNAEDFDRRIDRWDNAMLVVDGFLNRSQPTKSCTSAACQAERVTLREVFPHRYTSRKCFARDSRFAKQPNGSA
jgi:hypothetical protein